MVTIHLVTVWNFHTNNQSPYETCSYQIILCSIWIIFIPLTCHHLNFFHTKQNLKNFHTTYQSPYEMLSYGDNSYGDGLIGFTIESNSAGATLFHGLTTFLCSKCGSLVCRYVSWSSRWNIFKLSNF